MLLAVDLVSVSHTGQVLTDVLFQFLVAVMLYWLALRRSAAAGVAAGASALVRPIGLYLPLPVAFLAGLRCGKGFRARAAAAAFSAALLLPLGWVGRNKLRTGSATFSSIQGLNALLRAGVVEAEVSGRPFSDAYASLAKRLNDEYGPFANPQQESDAAGRLAASYIASHPVGYLRVCAKDVLKLLGGHGLDLAAWTLLKDPRYDPMAPDVVSGGFSGTRQLLERHPGFKVVLAAYWAFLVGLYALAARGLWMLVRAKAWDAAAIGGVPLLYFLGLTLGMGAYYRLRLPLMPPLCLLAAFGVKK
jgi:hypothetical protein